MLSYGFIDTHIRGFKGYDVVEGTKAVKNISKYLAKRGTTSFIANCNDK
ncbi:hypothetical protein NWE61_01790 [Mycoplasmopsis felis]|nr:hypothetical protein [Mycoplasmopsis felis]MCU9933931.1 hypothetical protein [Mycoplasmopsis felis]